MYGKSDTTSNCGDCEGNTPIKISCVLPAIMSGYAKMATISTVSVRDVETVRLFCKPLTHMLLFIVQEHHATHLHWDFRLEHDASSSHGRSPRPSMNPLITPRNSSEDHSLEYGSFEGTIPAGEYGAERCYLDQGSTKRWRHDGGPGAGSITFRLHGGKLNGLFSLIRLKKGTG